MNSNYTNCGLDENNQLVKKLKENLKLKDKELCETKRRLDECKDENNKLNMANQTLETDFKSLNIKFDDAVLCKSRLTAERDSLSDDLEIKYRQLCDLKAKYDKDVKHQKCSNDRLSETLTEVYKASVRNHYKMKNQLQKLQDKISAKKDELCNLKKKIKELERENSCNVTELNVKKNVLFEKECSLKRMAMILDKILKTKKCDVCCCPGKKIENQSTCPAYSQPICPLEDTCCSQPNPCPKPINQKCTTVANEANCNCTGAIDLKKLYCDLESMRNDAYASLKKSNVS